MTTIRNTFLALGAVVLGGCSVLGGSAPLDAYELRAASLSAVVQGSLARDLVVEAPTTGGALSTDRIMIRPDPLQAQYLPGVRWTDDAPVMLQNLMLRSFEQTGALRYVGRRPIGSTADYLLVSELTDFQAELAEDGRVTTRVAMSLRLVRGSDMAILGSRNASASAVAASNGARDVIEGFDTATSAVLADVTTWTLSRMGLRVTQ